MSGFSWYRTACIALCVAAVGVISIDNTRGADANDSGDGIDLVLLVDVSRSMMQSDGQPDGQVKDGSDPERIRWDAAKLVLDLLGPGDRLLVCRFNHGCPPIYNDGQLEQDNTDRIRQLKDLPFFKPWMSDFKMEFRGLTREREAIGREIESFNRTDDDIPGAGVGYLDIGSTKIVNALETVGQRLRPTRSNDASEPSHRPMHVMILTDGKDNDYKKYLVNSNSDFNLRQKLKFFTGEAGQGIGNGVKVPVHCIGLNLKGAAAKDNPEGAGFARQLLQNISHMTGGAFEEVNDNGELMEFFLCFTKSLRRCWVEEFNYPAGENRERIELLVANGLSELGVLSYRHAQKSNPKFTIEPLQDELTLDWVGLDGTRQAAPVPGLMRTGKGGTLYRLSYFERSVSSEGELGSSPFKQFNEPVTLKISVPPSATRQRLVLLKGTVKPLFELISPAPDSTYDRYDRIRIQVAMLSTEHFYLKGGPDYFRLTARISPVGVISSKGSSGTSTGGTFCIAQDGKQLGDSPVPSDVIDLVRTESEIGEVIFEGEVQRSSLTSAQGLVDLYQVNVTALGLSEPKHALSRTQQELPPRIFKIRNSLQLKKIDEIELSTDDKGSAHEFVVETIKPSRGDLPLRIKFTRPKGQDGMEVPEECIRVESKDNQLVKLDGQSQLILKDGRATVRMSLDTDSKSLKRGEQYSPGEFELTAVAGIQMEPLKIPVSLRLDLAKVQVQGLAMELQAEELEVPQDALTVVLAPKGRESGSSMPVTVSLQFLGAVDLNRTDASQFDDSELWLAADGENVDEPSRRKRTIQVKVGDQNHQASPFRIYLKANGTKTPMKYRCRLKVTGDWIASATHDFVIDKGSAAILVKSKIIRVPIGRGLSRSVSTTAWLGGLQGERAAVHVDGVQSGQAVSFMREDDAKQGADFQIVCPDIDSKVDLLSASETDNSERGPGGNERTDIKFVIGVPDDAPYGVYWREFHLVGANTKQQTLRLEVVVNGLEFDVLTRTNTTSENADAQWRPASERQLIQLLQTPMKQTLRIRTGLGDVLGEGDIVVKVADLFQDPSGDVPKLPVRLSKVRLIEGNKTALVDIDFPITPNRNEEGLPYTLHLVASSPFVATDDREPTLRDARYVKDIHFRFHVRYLHQREIISVRSLQVAPEQRQ